MNRHCSLKLIALLSLTTLPLGTIACSNGSSPTEPVFLEDDQPLVAASTSGLSSATGESRGRGGRGGRDDNNPRAGQEVEGTVTSVGQNSLTLANGTRIIVNGQTRWSARGDLHSLNQVARSLAANRPTRAEARGVRQGNGSFVAATLKVEVDD